MRIMPPDGFENLRKQYNALGIFPSIKHTYIFYSYPMLYIFDMTELQQFSKRQFELYLPLYYCSLAHKHQQSLDVLCWYKPIQLPLSYGPGKK